MSREKARMDLDLRKIGDECLTQTSKRIGDIDDYIKELVSQMKVKMVEWKGVGLAAPQVGHNIRLIIVKLNTGAIQEMINPRISWTSLETEKMTEGCLSIPNELVNCRKTEKNQSQVSMSEW